MAIIGNIHYFQTNPINLLQTRNGRSLIGNGNSWVCQVRLLAVSSHFRCWAPFVLLNLRWFMPTFGGSRHSPKLKEPQISVSKFRKPSSRADIFGVLVSNFMCPHRKANPAGVSMSLDSTRQIGVRPGAVGCGQITWGFWEGSLSRQEREYWLGYPSRLGVSFNHPVAFPSECHHCLGIKINAQPPKWMI